MTNNSTLWTAVLAVGSIAAVAAGYWMARAASGARGRPGDGRTVGSESDVECSH